MADHDLVLSERDLEMFKAFKAFYQQFSSVSQATKGVESSASGSTAVGDATGQDSCSQARESSGPRQTGEAGEKSLGALATSETAVAKGASGLADIPQTQDEQYSAEEYLSSSKNFPPAKKKFRVC